MSLDAIHATKHTHLWTRSVDGAEFANALYENEIDAALDFTAILVDIRRYADDGANITIEDVMHSLQDGNGMYAGVPGFIVVLSKCDGGCHSPTWN
jgi:hypothetical protein